MLSITAPKRLEKGTQVKMFIFQTPETAEESLQSWLMQNNVEIDHIVQSQSERNGKFLFIVSIFYKIANSH